MSESTTIRWEQDETGVVTLVLDDPRQAANTMNQAFRTSITAIADRAEAEKDSIRGIIYTSAKKSFFAGGDLKDMIKAGPCRGPPRLRHRRRDQERAAPHRDPRQTPVVAARQRHRPRRRLRDRPRRPPPRRPRHARLQDRPPRGHPRPAPRRRRRHPHRPPHGHRGRPAEGAPPRHPVHPAPRPRQRPRARTGGHAEEMLAKARAFIDAHPESRQPWDVPGYRIRAARRRTRSSPRISPPSPPTCASS